MGIFDFLKKAFAEEEGKETKELRLQELQGWLDEKLQGAFDSATLEIEELRIKINEEKNKLRDGIDALEVADLKNKDVHDRMKHIMEGNRRIFVQKVGELLNKIALPEKFDELPGFADSFDSYMEGFSKSVAKSHQVVSEFFPRESGAISVNVKNLDKHVKELKKVIENSGVAGLNQLKASVSRVEEKINRKEEIEGAVDVEKENLRKKEKEIKSGENRVNELESGKEYEEYLTLVGEKEELEKTIKEIEGELAHSFSEIEPGLKRYANLNKTDVLPKKYLEGALGALAEDKELKVVGLVGKVKTYIVEGSIEMKDKKRERALAELGKMDGDYFRNFLSRREELLRELEEVGEKISGVGVVKEIERMKRELNVVRGAVGESEKKISRLNDELEGIDVSELKKGLGEEIWEGINERVGVA